MKKLSTDMKKVLDKVARKVYTLQHGGFVVKHGSNMRRGFIAIYKHVVRLIFNSSKENPMSNSNIRSFWSRVTQHVSLGLVVASATLLAACGGGGGGAEPAPVIGTKTINSAITAGNLIADGLNAQSPVPVATLLGMTFVTEGSVGTVSASNVSLACDGTSLAVKPVVDGVSKTLSFGNAVPLPSGASCQASGDLTGSATNDGGGHPTAHFSYVFTTAAKEAIAAHGEMALAINTTRSDTDAPFVLVDGTGVVKVGVNKTSFQSAPGALNPIRLCGALVLDESATKEFTAWTTSDGYAVMNCQARHEVLNNVATPTMYNFLMNPVTGELGAKYMGTVPANVKRVDVPEGFGVTSYPAPADNGKGSSVVLSTKVFFRQAASGLGLSVTTDSFASHTQIDSGDLKVIVKIPAKI